MTEFTVISETSAVTLTVAGVVKEVVTIVVSAAWSGGQASQVQAIQSLKFFAKLLLQVAIFFFHDSFTVVKGIGLVVIIVGVCLFNWFK